MTDDRERAYRDRVESDRPVEVLAAFLDRCSTMAMSADDTSRVRALRDHLGE